MKLPDASESGLLRQLVEALRGAETYLWEPFVAVRLGAQDIVIFHPRVEPISGATMALIDNLAARGLIDVADQPSGVRLLQISPAGFAAVSLEA